MSPEYLAGFFDGEGTFKVYLQKAKHPDNPKMYSHHVVLLSQSGEDGLVLLEWIQKEYGGRIYQHLKPGQHKATKAAYKIYWKKAEAIKLLERLIPHLILKQKEAIKVYEYLTRKCE